MISSPIQLGCLVLLASLSASSIAAGTGKSRPSAQPYIVQLKSAPVASYGGGLSGLAATRVAEGQRLDARTNAAQAYRSHLLREQDRALALLGTGFKPIHRYSLALNGFAARLTPAQVRRLQASGQVRLLVPDRLRMTSSVSTPTFLGLDGEGGVWTRLRKGAALQGEDIIIGTIDTGVQPENPAFYDRVDSNGTPVASGGTLAYGSPPTRWRGGCVVAPAFPAGSCNNKLIGAKFFNAGWLASGSEPWFGTFSDSPRDENGHGSHTLSTAGGNALAPAYDSRGVYLGTTSGMAPRARLASYKALFTAVVSGQLRGVGASSDILAAVEAAVEDGVDVINFSVSSDPGALADPVEMAFLEASTANIFVAAAAGNSGPESSVQNPAPWVTTVGASTHDRNPWARLQLGNGQQFSGPSFNAMGVAASALVLGQVAAATGVSTDSANWCAPRSLDPAKVSGRIVVCDRGGDIARLDKSAEVKRAGGVGMVLLNTTELDLQADWHVVPTVNLESSLRTAVRSYAAQAGASASLSPRFQVPGATAPVMATFSSRGPNLADSRVMKPDVTAPGVGVIASSAYLQRNQAENYAQRAGTLVPPPVAMMLDGTSMATPHVAGIAALIRQSRPNWTPAMIQSALITTAGPVKLADGSTDSNMAGFGAGHVQATAALDPGLVYPANRDDYIGFLCGAGWLDLGSSECSGLKTPGQAELNQASIAGTVIGSLTVARKVRNVGSSSATYTASISMDGYEATVTPSSFSLGKGETAHFKVKFKRTTAPLGGVSQGVLTWTDGSHTVRSPIQLRAREFEGPTLISSVNSTDSVSASLLFGASTQVSSRLSGFQAATTASGRALEGGITCQPATVPAGTTYARASLNRNDVTAPSVDDVRLAYLDENGWFNTGIESVVGNEQITEMHEPKPGNYQLCLFVFSTALGYTDYKTSQWLLNGSNETGHLQATGWPTGTVKAGRRYPVTLDWRDLVPTTRQLAVMDLFRADGSLLNSTILSVDPQGQSLQRTESMRLPATAKRTSVSSRQAAPRAESAGSPRRGAR